jgi:spore coat protein D
MYNRHGGVMDGEQCPPRIFPAQPAPPQVSPTQECVKTNVLNTVVPHIHPSHTTTVNKHIFNHQHYFPHTESVVNECYEQHLICGVPYNPCSPPRSVGF